MYSDFAMIYDQLMDDVDYRTWADFYLQMISTAGVLVKDVAECGCGTGSLTIEFAKRGFRVIASDISEEMLMKAAEKARSRGVQVRFTKQDMRMLHLPKPVDAVVCGCDGVNYLLTDEDAKAFFQAAYKALRVGGILAFDVSSEEKLRKMIQEGLYGEDRDSVTYLWSNEAGAGDTVHMELTFFIAEKDGRYRRIDEAQTQRIYTWQTLNDLLCEAGFSDIRIYGDKQLNSPVPGDMRIHFLARKA